VSGLRCARATILQVSDIMAFSATAHPASNYADIPYHAPTWRKTLIDALRDPSQAVWAVWEEAKCCGLLVGMSAPMPWSLGWSATDLVFVADKGGELLLAKFVEWCDARKVKRIDMGVSDAGDRKGFDGLFRRNGFAPAGRMYYRQEAPNVRA